MRGTQEPMKKTMLGGMGIMPWMREQRSNCRRDRNEGNAKCGQSKKHGTDERMGIESRTNLPASISDFSG